MFVCVFVGFGFGRLNMLSSFGFLLLLFFVAILTLLRLDLIVLSHSLCVATICGLHVCVLFLLLFQRS